MHKKKIDSAYDLLHTLIDIPEDKIASYFNDKNLELIKMLYEDLIGGSCTDIKEVNDLSDMATLLNKKEAEMSKKLGNVILLASGFSEQGDIVKAVEVLQQFINKCNSLSHREIAIIEKENIEGST